MKVYFIWSNLTTKIKPFACIAGQSSFSLLFGQPFRSLCRFFSSFCYIWTMEYAYATWTIWPLWWTQMHREVYIMLVWNNLAWSFLEQIEWFIPLFISFDNNYCYFTLPSFNLWLVYMRQVWYILHIESSVSNSHIT